MKNFKLNAVRLGRKTKTGKRIYKLSGSQASLEFYREQQGEYLRTLDPDDADSAPLFFTSTLAQAGTITYNETNERFYLEPDFASEVMIEAAMRTFKSTETESVNAIGEADADDANLDETEVEEAPAKPAKPTGASKRKL